MSGRKRHLLVDTLGLLCHVLVHPASIPDRDGGQSVLAPLVGRFPRLTKLWVDAGCQGSFSHWVEETLGWEVEVVRKPRRWLWWPADQEPPPMPSGFQVLPHRWLVERTFAWLGRQRRLSKDYEVLPSTEEAWIYLTMIRLMVVRLTA